MKIIECRSCKSKKLVEIFSLGNQKLTGVFPTSKKQKVSGGNLDLILCKNCTLLQLKHSFDANEMYGENYGYMSSLNASMTEHLKKKSRSLINLSRLKKNEIVLDIGSNDGTFLSFFSKKNLLIGIDPTIKKFKNFYRKDIIKIPDFFSFKNIKESIGKKKVKLITSISMFYDLENPVDFAKDIEKTLDNNGIWHLEQSYMPTMLKNNSYDTICHEHLEYYSVTLINNLLRSVGLRIFDHNYNEINGGSSSYFICHDESKHKTNSKIKIILKNEKKIKLHSYSTYEYFKKRIDKIKKDLVKILLKLKKQKKTIHGYGASTKGNVLLQYFNIDNRHLDYISDRNPKKNNCFTPGSNVKIITESKSRSLKPDYYLVLPWHFKKEILKREKKIRSNGTKFIFPLPKINII